MRIGLKLWSPNTEHYLPEARRLFDSRQIDYVELYVVPGTLDLISQWKILGVPLVLHAPHFFHGMNLADKNLEASNRLLFEEVFTYGGELNTDYIVFHGGMKGDLQETSRQVHKLCRDYIIEPSLLVLENKPFWVEFQGSVRECCGYSPEEISRILGETGVSFCLDIAHALCSANSQGLDPYAYIGDFCRLNPWCFHINDENLRVERDSHLHIGAGQIDFHRVFDIIGRDISFALETNKDSPENLCDFERDAAALRIFWQAPH